MFDLWAPFWGNVFKGWRTDYGEADEEDVSLGVRERPQPVVVLLAGGVPEPERHRHSVTDHRGRVIVEPDQQEFERWLVSRCWYSHCRYIFSREAVRGVGDQHTSLAHSSVPHHHTLDWSPARHHGWNERDTLYSQRQTALICICLTSSRGILIEPPAQLLPDYFTDGPDLAFFVWFSNRNNFQGFFVFRF